MRPRSASQAGSIEQLGLIQLELDGMYMLVGLYFIIPIFHAWLERATRKDITDYFRTGD